MGQIQIRNFPSGRNAFRLHGLTLWHYVTDRLEIPSYHNELCGNCSWLNDWKKTESKNSFGSALKVCAWQYMAYQSIKSIMLISLCVWECVLHHYCIWCTIKVHSLCIIRGTFIFYIHTCLLKTACSTSISWHFLKKIQCPRIQILNNLTDKCNRILK